MNGFAPISSVPISSLPQSHFGAVEIDGRGLIEARLDVLEGLTADPKKKLIFSAEIPSTEIGAGNGPTTVYAATTPFITRSDDDPADQDFDGTLDGSLRIDRAISQGVDIGSFSQTISEVGLINADGAHDATVDANSVNGQELVLRCGEIVNDPALGPHTVSPLAEHEVFARLMALRWGATRSKVTIEAQDRASKLDVPAQKNIYAGTGDLAGGAELTGKRRPYGDGVVFNATPTLVIASEGVWQCHDGAVDEITDVKDGGISLVFDADYATSALLRAATLVPGEWASCSAEGYFRLGGTAVAQITVDFTGANLTTADIIEAAVLFATDIQVADIDAYTFEDLNSDQGASVGYFLSAEQDETVADMMTKLLRGIGGWWQFTLLGQLQVRRFEAPEEVAAAEYDTSGGGLIEIDRVTLPDAIDPPPSRRRIAYARNWTVQTQLYGQVSEDDPALAAYLGTAFKVAATSLVEKAAVEADYPFASDPPPVESYFAEEDDAQIEAERILDLYASGYKLYRARLKNALFVHDVGAVIKVTDTSTTPRLGLGDGKYLRLISVGDNIANGETDIVGFG